MDIADATDRLDEALRRCARLAATMCQADAARITLHGEDGENLIVHGQPAPGLHPLASIPLLQGCQQLGMLTLFGPGWEAGPGVNDAVLQDVAMLIAHTVTEARRRDNLERATLLGRRAEAMLQAVHDAPSCVDALAAILQELCQHHGAVAGRIWRILPGTDILEEVGRHNSPDLRAESYYHQAPTVPVTVATSFTGRVIASNQPGILRYANLTDKHRYALVQAALASGLKCQVSYPIWVDTDRFGLSLAFTTDRTDLPAVMADVASLANTIKPALFRKVAEEHIRFLAHHDELTGLPNRLTLNQRLEDALLRARAGEGGLALLFLDLDGFKPINDTQGHAMGDKLLAAVAGRLREGVRAGDTVARMGGDEFAVIQTMPDQPDSALALSQRLLELLGCPFEVDGRRLSIGVSIGVAVFPAHGQSPDELLRNADTALYRAKGAGRHTVQVFQPEMDETQNERARLERDLRAAVAGQEFTIVYQPLCDLATGHPTGFEALLRWRHRTRGVVPPATFIPLAEDTGLIVPLGRWVLQQACRDAAAWPDSIRLSVNLSPAQFKDRHLADGVMRVLAETSFPAHRLDLEVTEGLLLDDSGHVLHAMKALKAGGIGLTLDDFGTAYACLSYLRRFPFDRIKIDQSYVGTMTDDPGSTVIVEAILSISRQAGLAVVAEGVETPAQLDALRRLGCTCVQGYFVGRPMDASEAVELLRAT